MSEVQFSFDALSFLQEVLPEPEEATPTDSIIRRPTEPKPVEAKDENQTMLQDFARLQADQYDLNSMKKAPPVKSNLIQDYLDNLDMFYKDEQMNEAINSALMEATRPPIGQLSDTARTAIFSGMDMQGADLTMRDNAREAQEVFQPMVTPVSRGRQPEMADSPALVDAPSIDARSNEMLDKPMSTAREGVIPNRGLMQRRESTTDNIVKVALSANKDTESLSKKSIEAQVVDIVGKNMYAAGILGAFTKESGSNFSTLEENINYSMKNAIDARFSKAKRDAAYNKLSDEDKQRIDNGENVPAFGEALFDSSYSGGGRYRGRGLIHITHDYNYKAVGDIIGVDLVSNPELVNDPRYAVPAALAFLQMNDYFNADKPITRDRLHRTVNRHAGESVKNSRWATAQKYLKSFGKNLASNTSVRPSARPEPNIQVASN